MSLPMSRTQPVNVPPAAGKQISIRPQRRPRLRRPRREGERPRWDLAGVALAWLAGLS